MPRSGISDPRAASAATRLHVARIAVIMRARRAARRAMPRATSPPSQNYDTSAAWRGVFTDFGGI